MQVYPYDHPYEGLLRTLGNKKPLINQGSKWWRWAELNRRPKALHPQFYMLSSPLNLALKQYGVRNAPQDQPALG